jgi:hypothetical protein
LILNFEKGDSFFDFVCGNFRNNIPKQYDDGTFSFYSQVNDKIKKEIKSELCNIIGLKN